MRQALNVEVLDSERSFAAHGGDSLAYLAVQARLAGRIALPARWAEMPLGDVLANTQKGLPRLNLETLARVAAVLVVLMLHTTSWQIGGGTYLLLILAGFSLARFQFDALSKGAAWRAMRALLSGVLMGYFLALCAGSLLGPPAPMYWWLLLGNFVEIGSGPKWVEPFWFVSSYVQLIAVTALLFSLTLVRKLIARSPLTAGVVALVVLFIAAELSGLREIAPGHRHRALVGSAELFVLGWCAQFSTSLRARAGVLLIATCIVLGHWSDVSIGGLCFILMGVLALMIPVTLRVPIALFRLVSLFAASSLAIYLVHPFVVALVLRLGMPEVAAFLCVVFGSFGLAMIAARIGDWISALRRETSDRWKLRRARDLTF
jgi:hypothetical protein